MMTSSTIDRGAPATGSRWRSAWRVLADLVMATLIIWALPLALGAVAALIRLLF